MLPVLALLLVGAAARPAAIQNGNPKSLSVIVNQKNPTTNLTFRQLRSYLRLDQRRWPSKGPIALFLRPSKSSEMQVLLSDVYRMSSGELRKYWVGKVFRGEITYIGVWLDPTKAPLGSS